MHNSKALQILRTLGRTEWQAFLDYAQSPYCNGNANVVDLLKHISPHYPSFEHRDLDKKTIYKKVFAGKAFDEVYWRKQVSNLYQLLRAFLADEALRERPGLRAAGLLQTLRERALDNVFESQFARATEELQAGAVADEPYFLQAYLMAKEAFAYTRSRQATDAAAPLQAQVDNLDLFYLLAKLKYSCEMVLQQLENGHEFRFFHVPELLDVLDRDKHPFGDVPPVAAYARCLKMLLSEEDEAPMLQVLGYLKRQYASLSLVDLQQVHQYLHRYCMHRIGQGAQAFLPMLFRLYQSQLEQGLLLREGYLPTEDYKNIAALGLRLGAFGWVQEFLAQYRDQLLPHEREDNYAYHSAACLYAAGDAEGAIGALAGHRFVDTQYEINARYLLFKIYYEAGRYESLSEAADMLRLRLLRDKDINRAYRQSIFNFLILLKKLARLRADKGKMSAEAYHAKALPLREKAVADESLFGRSWLLSLSGGL